MFSLEYLGWRKWVVPLGCIFLNCVREDYKLWKILKVDYKLTRISIWTLNKKTFLVTVHIVLCASISICRCTKDMLSEREILWLSEGFYMIEPFNIIGLFSMSWSCIFLSSNDYKHDILSRFREWMVYAVNIFL